MPVERVKLSVFKYSRLKIAHNQIWRLFNKQYGNSNDHVFLFTSLRSLHWFVFIKNKEENEEIKIPTSFIPYLNEIAAVLVDANLRINSRSNVYRYIIFFLDVAGRSEACNRYKENRLPCFYEIVRQFEAI